MRLRPTILVKLMAALVLPVVVLVALFAIGTHYVRAELDRSELERVFAGETASSVTFEGNDGKTYKTGYAPVRASETEPQIVLALGAQAPASYFDRLDDLRMRLFLWGAG